MIEYNYDVHQSNYFDSENNEEILLTELVTREIRFDYPVLSDIDNAINNSVSSEALLNIVKQYCKGKANEVIFNIEDEWFNIQEEIQDKRIEKYDLSVENSKDSEDLNDKIQFLEEKIILLEGTRETLESNGWLKAYRGKETNIIRPEFDSIISKDLENKLISYNRDSKVRSLEDTVADLSKMNTLLMSFVTSIYGTLSDTNKAKIPSENKALIDFAVEKWPETQTRGDRQLQTEGTNLITKLFDREVKIADIIDEVKGE